MLGLNYKGVTGWKADGMKKYDTRCELTPDKVLPV